MAAVVALVYGLAYARWEYLWNRVDATVVDAAVVRWSRYTGGGAIQVGKRHSPNWVAVVHFRYFVHGQPYTGERLREQMPAFRRLDQAKAAIAGISPGMHIRAYVDPSDPENAFLFAKPGALEFILVVMGWFLLFAAWIRRQQRLQRAWLEGGGAPSSLPAAQRTGAG